MNQSSMTQPAQQSMGLKVLRVFAGVFGGMGLLVSLPMTLFALVMAFDPGSKHSVGIGLAVTFFFGLCALVSAAMTFFAFKPRKQAPFMLDANMERQILQIANMQQGVLTIGSLAMNSSLSTEQAQISLDELVRRGVATTTFDADGLLVYRFAGLSRGPAHVSHQKSSAQMGLDAFDQELARTSFDFDSSRADAEQAAHHSHNKKQS